MEDMSLEEEWLSGILGKSTRQSYRMGMNYFLEFLGLSKCEELKTLEKPEIRVLQFYQWLQDKKGLCSNSAVARTVAIQSFFSYIDRPLKLKRKLPQTHMKIENWKPTLENLQLMYSSGDICVKAWMSLSRDVPGRMSDMVKISPQQIQSGEFQILSQKEKIIGKAYVSEQTQTLFKQLTEAKLTLPRSGRGIDKMMDRISKIAGMPHRLNQHLFRKLFVSAAINLGISEMIWKILTFKTVPISDATYFLNGSELRTYWEKVINSIPLEAAKTNGKVQNLEAKIELLSRAVKKMLKVQEALEGIVSSVQYDKMTPEELLERYLET